MTKLRSLLYIPYVIADLIVLALSYIVIFWFLPLFADKDGNLPKYLYWFQTFDASLDEGWKSKYDGFNPNPQGFWQLYYARLKWLWRNPCYGFDYYPFGFTFDLTQWTIRKWESNDQRELFIATGQGLFSIIYYGKYGTWKLGWKAWNYFDSNTGKWKENYSWGDQHKIPLCFSPNINRRKV
ncbi:hypothetical protein [Ralstonia phage RP13]|nr:hypothetical protein [Ralstonia phage RP13]